MRELHLFLTDTVEFFNCTDLTEAIIKANNEKAIFECEYMGTVKETMQNTPVEHIYLHIASVGGYCDAGMLLVNAIASSTIPVTAIISSAHSMASIIAVACDYRKMYKTGKIMLHDTSGMEVGKLENMKENIKTMELERNIMDNFVLERTSLTKKELDKINKAKVDKYFFAEEAMEKGLIHEIIHI